MWSHEIGGRQGAGCDTEHDAKRALARSNA